MRLENACQRISSFEKNPARPGVPAMARVPMAIVQNVIGIFFLKRAHLPHVLLVVHGVNHAAGTKEQAGP